MREIAFLVVLLIAAACVVVGVSTWSVGLAWIVGGVLLAATGWLALGGAVDTPGVDE
jgi:hypothetical protein